MKNFFSKVFLFLSAIVATLGGMLFFMTGLKRISIREVISAYTFISQKPEALKVLLILGFAFCSLGLILFTRVFTIKKSQKSILIKEKGYSLRIPQAAVKDFIDQILAHHSYLSDCETVIRSNQRWIYINIFSAFDGAVSIRQKVSQIRQILKEEIERTLGFDHFKINFQIKAIIFNPDEKKNQDLKVLDKEQLEDKKNLSREVLDQRVEPENEYSLIEAKGLGDKEVKEEVPWRI